MREVETIVVGGGPAGAACAGGLARLGREVVLVERTGAPHHKVCGEFLSVETQVQLRRLGIEPIELGAVSIDRVAVYSGTRAVTTTLPFRALSLSRFRLDEALLRCAESLGAQLRRNVSVRAVIPAKNGWAVRCGDGETLCTRNLVLATGKWGVRGLADARVNSLVGLKMHLRLAPQVRHLLTGRVELVLLNDSYAGLELVEGGIANLCLLLPRAVVARFGANWSALRNYLMTEAPCLTERLAGGEPLWNKPITVVCPTGGHLHEEAEAAVYRVGDRLAHIPPFTGDGLAIALSTAALAVEHIQHDRPPSAYLAAARQLTGKAIHLATAVSGIAASRIGRSLLLRAAAHAPVLFRTIVQATRLSITSAA